LATSDPDNQQTAESQSPEKQRIEAQKREVITRVEQFLDKYLTGECSEFMADSDVDSIFDCIEVGSWGVSSREYYHFENDDGEEQETREDVARQNLIKLDNLRRIAKRLIDAADDIEITNDGVNSVEFKITMPFTVFASKYRSRLVEIKAATISADKLKIQINGGSGGKLYYNDRQADNWDKTGKEWVIIDDLTDKVRSGELEPAAAEELESNHLFMDLSRFDREKVYAQILTKYAQLLEAETKLTDELSSLRRLYQVALDYGAKSLVKEVLVQATQGDDELIKNRRWIRRYHGNKTLAQLNEFIKDKPKKLTEMDAERWRLHRFIERFAFLYQFGRNKIDVKYDLEARYNQIHNESINIDGKIYLNITDDSYTIYFGAGGFTSVRWDSLVPAPIPGYNSYIAEGNSFDDDKQIADECSQKLRGKFIDTDIVNQIGVHGSTHEKWVDSDIRIARKDIINWCKENELDEREAIDMIAAIFKKTVEQARIKGITKSVAAKQNNLQPPIEEKSQLDESSDEPLEVPRSNEPRFAASIGDLIKQKKPQKSGQQKK